MAPAIVTIICIAMIVVGGMTLSQGILTSTDSTASSLELMSVREGEMMRTNLDALRAAQLSSSDYFRIAVKNSGQTKLASYDKWDIIINYEDAGGTMYSAWLPYSVSEPENNQWQKARIGLNGPLEYFEPDILNPGEEMVILAHLDPLPGSDTSGEISLTTPNGIFDSISFVNPGYLRLTPQSENISLPGTKYYELVEAAAGDGSTMTAGTTFADSETGRKLLYNTLEPARAAKFLYPLIGIKKIPAGEWTVNYRCWVSGSGFPQGDNVTSFNIDVLVRDANGNLRDSIDTEVAIASFMEGDTGNWVTLTGVYNFPGYDVMDENDSLEIDYYGETIVGPEGGTGNMQIIVDDSSLPISDQTRIQAY